MTLDVKLKFVEPNASYTVYLLTAPGEIGCEGTGGGSFVVTTNAKGMGRGTGSLTLNTNAQGKRSFAAAVYGSGKTVYTPMVTLAP